MMRASKFSWFAILTTILFLSWPCYATLHVLPGSEQQVEQSWLDRWYDKSTLEPTYVNRLVLSDSAYLYQHADNPIDWYPWDQNALALAKEKNRLIFVSIGYASCHWCHVMEVESFSDVSVASLLNQTMISIKVDREQKPDIDAHFTLAVEAIKGESGWPITMILLPDLTPVFAANYLSKEQLITVVSRLNERWKSQPGLLAQNAALVSAQIAQYSKVRVASATLPQSSWADLARQRLLNELDPDYGGFGLGSKFPSELKLQFLLNTYKKSQDSKLRDILVEQLDTQMRSGLSDVVFGGVFRYTTDRQLSRPHFEKMLYNQALTVILFADAATWLGEPAFKQYSESIVRFVKAYMQLSDGTYAAALDADHGGVEGGYYLWPETAVENLEDNLSSVSFGNQLVYLLGSPVDEGASWRQGLIAQRHDRPKKIENSLTSWNALWIRALLSIGDTAEAEILAEKIWNRSWTQKGLLRIGDHPGFLDDYSYLSQAFWQLYLKSVNAKWKDRARMIDKAILDRFFLEGNLSYHDRRQPSHFSTDVSRDSELPSPLAASLQVFRHHQTEKKFIVAYESLKAGASQVIGDGPESYLTLLQSLGDEPVATAHVIAKGHGMISLQPAGAAGLWNLVVDLDENWHINANRVTDQWLIPTRVLGGDEIRAVNYPEGHEFMTEFSETPLSVYSGRVDIQIEADAGLSSLSLQVQSQACNNKVCLLPEEHRFKTSVTPIRQIRTE